MTVSLSVEYESFDSTQPPQVFHQWYAEHPVGPAWWVDICGSFDWYEGMMVNLHRPCFPIEEGTDHTYTVLKRLSLVDSHSSVHELLHDYHRSAILRFRESTKPKKPTLLVFRRRLPKLPRKPKLTRSKKINKIMSSKYDRALLYYKKRMLLYEYKFKVVEKRNSRMVLNYKRSLLLWEKRVNRFSRKLVRSMLLRNDGSLPINDYLRCHLSRDVNLSVPPHQPVVWGLWEGTAPERFINLSYSTAISPSDLTSDQQKIAYRNMVYNLAAVITDSFTLDLDYLKSKNFGKSRGEVLHLGNIIAERNQTVNLLISSYRRLLNALVLHKGLIKRAGALLKDGKSLPKSLANDYLAFKFGLQPLLNDLDTLMRKIVSDNPPLRVVKSQHTRTLTREIQIGPGEFFTFSGKITSRLVSCHELDRSHFEKLSEYGLTNPLEVLWEMIPWSFVVDWVLPINNLLLGFTGNLSMDHKWTTHSYNLTGVFGTWLGAAFVPLVEAGIPFDFEGVSTSLPAGEYTGSIKVRRKINLDLPSIVTKNPYSSTHLLESISLLVQRARR